MATDEAKDPMVVHLEERTQRVLEEAERGRARLQTQREDAEKYGDIRITYETAREVLYLIEEVRGGPGDQGPRLNALMLKFARGLPDRELPDYLGGPYEEDPNEGE